MGIIYLIGDATIPDGRGNKIIAHICNDIGGWGKGFVLAISARWKKPENEYRKWYAGSLISTFDDVCYAKIESIDADGNEKVFGLGNVQFVRVEEDIWVANMIAQRDIIPSSDGRPPIRYHSLRHCLMRLSVFAKGLNAVVHMPRIGCGLAGGEWSEVEKIIHDELTTSGVKTVVYDFK